MERIDNSLQLPKEFKDKWLEALRSNRYMKGSLVFYTDEEGPDRYCILGVAGLLCGYTKEELKGHSVFGKNSCIIKRNLPKELIGQTYLVRRLTKMNDSGYTFNYIADYIERNVKTY